MNPLKISFDYKDDVTKVFFDGTIDENAKLPSPPKNQSENIVIDLGKVLYINSIGIRSWAEWIDKFIKKLPKSKIFFKSCPKVIVTQMNSIRDFCPESVIVESFEVPYYCDPCNNSIDVAYRRGKEFMVNKGARAILNHPPVDCPQCGGPMEPDVLEEKYFAFLNKD